MIIVEIKKNENGSHTNVKRDFGTIPEGWAVVPDSIIIPDTFPFVDITVENGVVTSMTAGTMPDPEPEPEPELTMEDLAEAALDLETRLLMLEQMQA